MRDVLLLVWDHAWRFVLLCMGVSMVLSAAGEAVADVVRAWRGHDANGSTWVRVLRRQTTEAGDN